MSGQIVNVMVNGGKATAGPPLGPALGPLGVPVGKVIAKINEETKQFDGMQVPVKVIVNPATRTFEIEVGVPPASALIKKEIGIEKGTGDGSIVGNVTWDQLKKVAKEKEVQCLGADTKHVIKELIGTCVSMGVTVEGKPAKEFFNELDKFEV